jgi:hypothetical protein
VKLTSIKIGQKYQEVRNNIIKSDNLVLSSLPAFMMTDYDVAENLDTKEKTYILRDLYTGIITDVTTDISKIYNKEQS